jgi:hypothetical protein
MKERKQHCCQRGERPAIAEAFPGGIQRVASAVGAIGAGGGTVGCVESATGEASQERQRLEARMMARRQGLAVVFRGSGTRRVEDARSEARQRREVNVTNRQTRGGRGDVEGTRGTTPGVGIRPWRGDGRQGRLRPRAIRPGAGKRNGHRPGGMVECLVVRDTGERVADVIAACAADRGGRQRISQQQGHDQPGAIPHQTLRIGLLHGS